jgi:hypothetical protein
MGSSPSAELYWGYNLGEMVDADYEPIGPSWLVHEEDFNGDDRDWREELATRLGWEEVPFPEDICPVRSMYTSDPHRNQQLNQKYKEVEAAFYKTPEYLAYSASRDRMCDLVKDCPAELYIWSSSEDPAYCVRILASVQRADDWGSTELKPLEVETDWYVQLHRFMQLLELPIPEGKEPGWHMCCAYG